MSSHLVTLTIGLTIGSGATYLAIAIWSGRHRAKRGVVAEVLELACPPLKVTRAADLPRAEQSTLFRPMQPCMAQVPDTPAMLFLRSADTQPSSS